MPGADGTTYFVVALEDPGYANWLDPCGVDRGTVHIRYDGVDGEIPADAWPSARLVNVNDIPTLISGIGPADFDEASRRAQISMRRRHVQIRYGR